MADDPAALAEFQAITQASAADARAALAAAGGNVPAAVNAFYAGGAGEGGGAPAGGQAGTSVCWACVCVCVCAREVGVLGGEAGTECDAGRERRKKAFDRTPDLSPARLQRGLGRRRRRGPPPAPPPPTLTTPRPMTPHTGAAPAAAAPRPAARRPPASNNAGPTIRSLADLRAEQPPSEDDDDNEYYAGGEKSGQVRGGRRSCVGGGGGCGRLVCACVPFSCSHPFSSFLLFSLAQVVRGGPKEPASDAVADVFDALTSERPYKKAWEVEEAIDFLNNGAGTHFDPACVKAFLNAWDDVDRVRCQYQEDQHIGTDL